MRALVGTVTTLLFVVVGWVFFRAPTLATATAIVHKMFVLDATAAFAPTPALVASVSLMVGGHVLGALRAVPSMELRLPSLAEAVVCGFVIAALLLFAPDGTQAFIYFQF
jgi:hypothetical protein